MTSKVTVLWGVYRQYPMGLSGLTVFLVLMMDCL